MDEARALPSEEAVRVDLRTQQILAYESGVINTIDPLGGSYYVESLTSQIEEEARGYIKKIDSMGGAIGAIEKGFFQKEIAESAFNYQTGVESGERVVVGVNKFKAEEEIPIKALRVDPEVERKQIERLNRLKRERDNSKVKECLKLVKEIARGEGNLVPPILEAVRAYTTVGEICDALREVFGEYRAEAIYY